MTRAVIRFYGFFFLVGKESCIIDPKKRLAKTETKKRHKNKKRRGPFQTVASDVEEGAGRGRGTRGIVIADMYNSDGDGEAGSEIEIEDCDEYRMMIQIGIKTASRGLEGANRATALQNLEWIGLFCGIEPRYPPFGGDACSRVVHLDTCLVDGCLDAKPCFILFYLVLALSSHLYCRCR